MKRMLEHNDDFVPNKKVKRFHNMITRSMKLINFKSVEKSVEISQSVNNFVLPNELNKIILELSGDVEIVKMQKVYPELLRSAQIIDVSQVDKSNYKYIVNGMGMYNFTDEDLQHMPNLISLNLWDNCLITDEGIKHLTNLTSLNLGKNYMITDDGIKNLTKLKRLVLWDNCNITDYGIINLTNLTTLNLGNGDFNREFVRITNDGIKKMVNLTNLCLEYNTIISDEGIKDMIKLEVLDLTNTKRISNEMITQLPNLIRVIGK